MEIVKSDGTRQEFNEQKLIQSLKRSGASDRDAQEVADKITASIRDGDTTSQIYERAFETLKSIQTGVAAKYSLRKALGELGPTGFPFEVFVAELYRVHGYEAKVGTIAKGKCITHEVDLIASSETELILGELKFRNKHSIKTEVKVPLYVHSRFDDLKDNDWDGQNPDNLPVVYSVMTNTRFTRNAIDYARCIGMRLIGWSYPEMGNLQELIEGANIEPLTILTTLNANEKRTLLDNGVVMCKAIFDDPDVLHKNGIDPSVHDRVLEEVSFVCGHE